MVLGRDAHLFRYVDEAMIHKCHARGCNVPTRPEVLMCFRHWGMVPHTLRSEVWRYYRAGQCDDKQVSREWLNAADAAIEAVAAKEAEQRTRKAKGVFAV